MTTNKTQGLVSNGSGTDLVLGRIRELDGWRAISVTLVIIHHLLCFRYSKVISGIPLAPHIFWNMGRLGVKVFFVISGFVICRLLLAEEQRSGSISLRGFYLRRAFRILPPLLLLLGTIVLLDACGFIRIGWASFAEASAFLADFREPTSWFLGHTWSLAVEEQFYLLFPALMLFTPAGRRNFLFGFAFTICIAWTLILSPSLKHPLAPDVTRSGFACICFGVVTALNEQRFRAIARRIPIFAIATLAFLLIIHPPATASTIGFLWDASLTPICISAIILYSLETRGTITSFLCCRPTQIVGLASYSIYLWQQLLTAPSYAFQKAGPSIAFVVLLSLFAIPGSFFLVEKPAIRLGRMLLNRDQSTIVDNYRAPEIVASSSATPEKPITLIG